MFKDIKNNEDKKNSTNYYEMKYGGIKPSQRIIQNMIRKEKKLEMFEKSLLDFFSKVLSSKKIIIIKSKYLIYKKIIFIITIPI